MKKLLILGLSIIIAMASCSEDEETKVSVSKVEITPTTLGLIEGETKQLSVEVLPENAMDKSIVWSSSNESVATVDESGKVTAVKEGQVDIVATSNNDVKGVCKLTVAIKQVPITDIVVEPGEMTLLEGESQKIQAYVYPSNTTESYKVTLNSTNPDVALIDDYGEVYAKAAGTADIEVVLNNGMKGICKVTVVAPSNLIMDIPSVETIKKRGYVQKVMKGDEQVGQICLEYIKTSEVAEQMLVVYPCTEGVVNLAKGVSLKDGGAIVWDETNNTCTYTKGTMTPTQINFVDGIVAVTEKSEYETQTVSMVTDILVDKRSNDTQNYRIVKIGTQYWMAENLRAEHDVSGVEIPNLTETKEWLKDARGAMCYYENDETNKEPYGALYNFYAIKNLDLAPAGYHVTKNEDWIKLAKYLDPDAYDENAIDYETYQESTSIAPLLKSTTEWKNDGNGNNLSGLNVYPAGDRIRSMVGDFFSKGAYSLFWVDDVNTENTSYFRRIFYDMNIVNIFYENIENGYSVRCVRD